MMSVLNNNLSLKLGCAKSSQPWCWGQNKGIFSENVKLPWCQICCNRTGGTVTYHVENLRCHHAGMTNYMMTSSNGNISRVTGPLCGEFTGPGEFPAQRPVTRSFDIFFDLRLNKRLTKQPWSWWFETPAWSLWRHRNGLASWHTHSSKVSVR